MKRRNVRSSSARLAMLLAVALLAGNHIASAQQPAIQRKVLLQQDFADKDSRGRHEHGWGSSFVCLEQEATRSV